MGYIAWSLKDFTEILKDRIKNELDSNIAVTGSTGMGKSTFTGKLFYRLKGFKPNKHQVYSRKDVINLLKNQQKGFVWADEMISVGYKRSFYESQQQELIKVLNAFRDNFNILGACIPNFFSLDKDLRDIFYFHFHIVERGIAILHTPLKSRLYAQDKWDVSNNSKIENKWSQRIMKDPNFANHIPYHNLSTFRGILYFNKMTIKQEKLYKLIKREKRKQSFGGKDEIKVLSFDDRILS